MAGNIRSQASYSAFVSEPNTLLLEVCSQYQSYTLNSLVLSILCRHGEFSLGIM